jgi:ComF family protein
MKYKFAQSIADELSTHISATLLHNESLLIGDTFALVPIPMHWHRLNWRGFNQVEEIGEKVSRRLGFMYVPHVLVRTQERQSQASLDMQKRKVNIQGVFHVNRKYRSLVASCDTTWVLFDDVYTTGATLKEAGSVLKKSGAKKVWALTITR